MVALGADSGVRTVALLTDMDTPLGLTAGNALEVRESVEVLAGGGPADVVELTVALAREMLPAAGLDGVDPADRLRDGSAMDVWRRMIRRRAATPTRPCRRRARPTTCSPRPTACWSSLDAYAVGRRRLAARRRTRAQGGPGAGRRRRRDARQARCRRSAAASR